MFNALESYLESEALNYKRNSPAFFAIKKIIKEIQERIPLDSILTDEDLIKANLPEKLRRQLTIRTLSNVRIIEDCYAVIGTALEGDYFKELNRRLFDNDLKKGMEKAFNQPMNPKFQQTVIETEINLLRKNYYQLKKATFRYLGDCSTNPIDSDAKLRKKTMQSVEQFLNQPKQANENALLFFRNRIKNATDYLHSVKHGEILIDKIKEDRSPTAKIFLATVAAVSSLLMIGIPPTLGAMLYTKIRYGTFKFWEASNGQRLHDATEQIENSMGLNMVRKR